MLQLGLFRLKRRLQHWHNVWQTWKIFFLFYFHVFAANLHKTTTRAKVGGRVEAEGSVFLLLALFKHKTKSHSVSSWILLNMLLFLVLIKTDKNGLLIWHVWSPPHDSLHCPHGEAKGSYSSFTYAKLPGYQAMTSKPCTHYFCMENLCYITFWL